MHVRAAQTKATTTAKRVPFVCPHGVPVERARSLPVDHDGAHGSSTSVLDLMGAVPGVRCAVCEVQARRGAEVPPAVSWLHAAEQTATFRGATLGLAPSSALASRWAFVQDDSHPLPIHVQPWVHLCARVVQRAWRRFVARQQRRLAQQLARERAAAPVLRRAVRRYVTAAQARVREGEVEFAATLAQMLVRGFLARVLRKRMVAAREVQRVWRGVVVRIKLQRARFVACAATVLQAAWRGRQSRTAAMARRRWLRAIIIQRVYRGHLGRRTASLRTQYLRLLFAYTRKFLRPFVPAEIRRHRAAVPIQARQRCAPPLLTCVAVRS